MAKLIFREDEEQVDRRAHEVVEKLAEAGYVDAD